MHEVAVLALDGVIPFELSIPSRVFGATEHDHDEPLYRVRTCGIGDGPVRTTEDFAILPEHGPGILATADTVVIPAAYADGDPVYERGELSPEVAAALALVRPGTRMASICLGSYVLAAAGYLDGRTATTHWWHAGHFQRLFPGVRVDAGVLFTDDGDVLTSAGAAAGLDLCLHMIRRDHGAAVANAVARTCVAPPWRDGGQAQYVDRPVPPGGDDGTSPTRAWLLARLDRPVSLTEMAAHARMSRRTFTRRFREETGQSPVEWLTDRRLDAARGLLETTGLAVDQIAARVGFGGGTSLRQHMRASYGVSPAAYRRTFAGGEKT
ncbi:AraC family transcriptional regulator [Actinorhabdospora filicis]|uniref:AraC family transcriptional regulator n=1 Tax=Actinorhabdospora filicis TaxID=1785913 RepID=A0A9W6SNU5_9ACTN|nr:helix-turn-helix domain-containing protein [Actinorhabdospora filicis]GLZ79290.1 AraC family transcriptional regulator [Actinorhabdospora filicis]